MKHKHVQLLGLGLVFTDMYIQESPGLYSKVKVDCKTWAINQTILKKHNMADLSVQSVSSTWSPPSSHVHPGDDEDVEGLDSFFSGESLLDVLSGSTQYLRASVLPVEDRPLSVTVVQVSQQSGNHWKTGGHLPQVHGLSWRVDDWHKSIGVNLE